MKKVSQEDFIKVCEFLAKEGYLDDDWWCEEPTALQRYLKVSPKPCNHEAHYHLVCVHCGKLVDDKYSAEPYGYYDDTHNKDRLHPPSESEVERCKYIIRKKDIPTGLLLEYCRKNKQFLAGTTCEQCPDYSPTISAKG